MLTVISIASTDIEYLKNGGNMLGIGSLFNKSIKPAIISICISSTFPAQAQSPRVSRAIAEVDSIRRNEHLIKELSAMGAIGLLIREQFLEIRKDATPEERRELDTVWGADYAPFDRRNTEELRGLLNGRGWFRRSEVGRRAAGYAFDVVQHSDDLNFQKEILKKMAPLVGTTELNGEHYALLYDRVAVAEGRPQRFGSQGTDCRDGKYAVPSNVEDPANLDKRRAEMGMAPIAQALQELDSLYGRCEPPAGR